MHTRFLSEPKGYLHIGHAKAIWIDYGIAQDFNGLFNMRFDDTNPVKEEQEYVDAILNDARWLGAEWGGRLFFASLGLGTCLKFPVPLNKPRPSYP